MTPKRREQLERAIARLHGKIEVAEARDQETHLLRAGIDRYQVELMNAEEQGSDEWVRLNALHEAHIAARTMEINAALANASETEAGVLRDELDALA